MNWKYTTIQYGIMDKYGLSMIDYALADLIRRLQAYPYSKTGWCLHGAPQLASALRLSESTIKRSIGTLREKGILESDPVLPQQRRITEGFILDCDLDRETPITNQRTPPVQNEPPAKLNPLPVQNDPATHRNGGVLGVQNDPVLITVGNSNILNNTNNNPEPEKAAMPVVVVASVENDREQAKGEGPKDTFLIDSVEDVRADLIRSRIFAESVRKGTGCTEEYYKTLVHGFCDERLADIDAKIHFGVGGLKLHFKNWFYIQMKLGTESKYHASKQPQKFDLAPADIDQEKERAEQLARIEANKSRFQFPKLEQ